MLDVPGLVEESHKLYGEKLILLLEIEYADNVFARFFQSPKNDEVVTAEGVEWTSLGFEDPARSASSDGQIPAFQIAIANVGQQVQSIVQHHIVEERPGRLITAHRDHLDDPSAMFSAAFIVESISTNIAHASIACKQVPFNPLRTLVPRRLVSRKNWPGVPGATARFV